MMIFTTLTSLVTLVGTPEEQYLAAGMSLYSAGGGGPATQLSIRFLGWEVRNVKYAWLAGR